VHEYFRLRLELLELQEGGNELKSVEDNEDDDFLEEDTGL
jgi:hypothetical protein